MINYPLAILAVLLLLGIAGYSIWVVVNEEPRIHWFPAMLVALAGLLLGFTGVIGSLWVIGRLMEVAQ